MGALAVGAFPSPNVDVDAAMRMLLAAPHRGTKLQTRSHDRVVLGVSSNGGPQDAWLATSGDRLSAFVGELDNADELRRELAEYVGKDELRDPAAVVLAAFGTWGDDAPARLRGRFVGAVSDGTVVRCFRDQLGLRTLYHGAGRDGATYVATEPQQVLAGTRAHRRADRDALTDIFYGRLSERGTAVAGVERFPRATVAAISGRDARFRRYWDPSALLETARLTPEEAAEGFLELLEAAVARTLTGEDAVSLSGGIDSPAIAVIAAPQHLERFARPLKAVSAVYPDQPSVDERSYIELVTRRYGMPLHAYVPSARPLDDVELWADRLNGPVEAVSVPEIVENYRVAARAGVATLLTGELAEYVISMRHHLLGHFVLHRRWRAALDGLRWERNRRPSWLSVARALAPSLLPPIAARAYFSVRTPSVFGVPGWVDRTHVGGDGRPDLQRPARRRWLEAQIDPLRGAATTVEADEILAAHCGVRVRRPLADIDLWEFFLRLPAEVKFPEQRSKALVRRSMRGRIPDEILDRRDKTSFEEHALAIADYEALEHWLVNDEYRVAGVDYALLTDRLRRRSLGALELTWAYDLAKVHAFARRCGT